VAGNIPATTVNSVNAKDIMVVKIPFNIFLIRTYLYDTVTVMP
jgi:hypothetical protein